VTCSHRDCNCKKCGVILDSKSPLTYLGLPVDQCWRCWQEQCEEEV